jgi:hypothetical protein
MAVIPAAVTSVASTAVAPYLIGSSETDGFADAAEENAGRLLRGGLLTFVDGHWRLGKDSAPVNLVLMATQTLLAWIYWWSKRIVDEHTVLAPPRQKAPARETLGHLDPSKWELGPDGKPGDPYVLTRYVYLVSIVTAESFTFSTGSQGGHRAVADLSEAVRNMRQVHPQASPVISLGVAPWPTGYGMKTRPHLKIEGWRNLRDDGDVQPAQPRLLSPS